MKLRNKKTGEIGNLVLNTNPNRESYSVLSTENGDTVCANLVLADYESLAELNAEWCDVEEEPKRHWIIDTMSDRVEDFDVPMAFNESIGNYFKTKEEAEKAVEKLKAFKRLKDGGITFKNWTINQTGTIDCFATWGNNIPPSRKDPVLQEDLDLLFSGEDD